MDVHENRWDRYEQERAAYYDYVKVLSGEALVRGQRISGSQVAAARNIWIHRLDDLRAVASPAEVRALVLARYALEANDA